MPDDIHVLALVRGEQKYFFLWRDKDRATILRTFARWASEFSWYDAAELCKTVRRSDAPAREVETFRGKPRVTFVEDA